MPQTKKDGPMHIGPSFLYVKTRMSAVLSDDDIDSLSKRTSDDEDYLT